MSETVHSDPSQIEGAEKLQELRDILGQKAFANADVFAEKRKVFMDDLVERFGRDQLHQVLLYHLLIGSTEYDKATRFDLPGSDIESFIRDLDIPEEEQE